MRISHYILGGGVALGVIGFIAAALLDQRPLGMTIFLIGFFVGATSGVYIALTSTSGDFGRLGTAIKAAAGGFALIVFGQLVGFLFDENSAIGRIFFFVGMAVMLAGIVIAVLRMTKS